MKCCDVCRGELGKCESCGYLKMRHDGSCSWCGWIRMASVPEPECNGICLWAADIGVPEAGDVVAYIHPACPAHGNPTDGEICPACDDEICRCW